MKYCGVGLIILAAGMLLNQRQKGLNKGERLWKEMTAFLNFLDGKMSFEGSPLWSMILEYGRSTAGESHLFLFRAEENRAPHEAIRERLEEYDIPQVEKEQLIRIISSIEEQTEENAKRKILNGIEQAEKMQKEYEDRKKKERSVILPLIAAWTAMLILVLL